MTKPTVVRGAHFSPTGSSELLIIAGSLSEKPLRSSEKQRPKVPNGGDFEGAIVAISTVGSAFIKI